MLIRPRISPRKFVSTAALLPMLLALLVGCGGRGSGCGDNFSFASTDDCASCYPVPIPPDSGSDTSTDDNSGYYDDPIDPGYDWGDDWGSEDPSTTEPSDDGSDKEDPTDPTRKARLHRRWRSVSPVAETPVAYVRRVYAKAFPAGSVNHTIPWGGEAWTWFEDAGKTAGWTPQANGNADIANAAPRTGDILCFGKGTETGTQSGHVAIVTGRDAHYIYVQQANVLDRPTAKIPYAPATNRVSDYHTMPCQGWIKPDSTRVSPC
jgi:hypothetical protein